MVSQSFEVRRFVAWLQLVRWTTCGVLCFLVAAIWLLPHLDLPLRAIAPFGLAAAICRTAVVA
jgi:hypothetical protein